MEPVFLIWYTLIKIAIKRDRTIVWVRTSYALLDGGGGVLKDYFLAIHIAGSPLTPAFVFATMV